MEKYIEETIKFVKNKLSGEITGHDWWHAYRVWQNSKLILRTEQSANRLIVELSALLHDISDWKFNNGNENIGCEIAEEFLKSIKIEDKITKKITEIIKTISFKGAKVKTPMKTIEGKIVQDADRLDAIGAIGIARTFAYGAYVKQEIYNPEIKPKLHNSFEEYKNSKSTSINHFYEKLLLLSEQMNTKKGIELAHNRQIFMKKFLKKFFSEWECKS